MLDDLAEAIQHAIIGICARALASLQLPVAIISLAAMFLYEMIRTLWS